MSYDEDTPENIRVKKELAEQYEQDRLAFNEEFEKEEERLEKVRYEKEEINKINQNNDKLERIEAKLDLLLKKFEGL